MALFASAKDVRQPTSGLTPWLSSTNFVASAHSTNAHAPTPHGLVVSATTQIIGRFQLLKSLSHPNLCEYVDIVKGKHDRIFVVSEHHENSVHKIRRIDNDEKPVFSVDNLRQWSLQVSNALRYLHLQGVVHRSLAPHNIWVDSKGRIKLTNYGLFYMTGNSSDVDFPIGYPQYLSPETVANWNDRRSVPKADVWSLGIILLELYLGNPFWSRSEIGPIFDSLLTLLRWQGETIAGLFIEPADVWRHKDLSKLAVNTRALHFLQGPHDGELEDNDTAQFRSFVKVCLEVDVAHRPSSEQLFSHPFFARFVFDEGVDPTLLSSWSLKPYLQSDKFEITDENFEEILKNKEITMDDETLDDTMASPLQPTRVDPLQGLPLLQIYHFWKLAGGDVESDLVKRGILLSTPVIERLPRVVKVADGKEEGGAKRDTAYLYSDATSVLSFKELHQRLEEAKRPNRNSSTESDNDHPQVVDENDINFLIDEPNEKKKVRRARQNSSRNPEINGGDAANGQINSDYDSDDSKTNDFIFTENLPNPQSGQSRPQTPLFPTTPTTPGALPSPIFGTPPIATGHFAHTLRHSNSSPSLGGISSPSSINPPSIVNTAPRPPLLIREKDVAYQFHRVTLFSELLRQYPASTREIVHHAKVDIPPLLRGKVWAVILGVTGDVEEDYNSIDKETEKPSDRQIEVDIPRCHQYNQLLASDVGHEKLRRLLKCWVAANSKYVYWQGVHSLFAPFVTLNFNDEALAFACVQRLIPRFLCNFFLPDNSHVIKEYLSIFRLLLSFHDPALSKHLDDIEFKPDFYAIPWFLTLFTHVFPLDKIYHLWDKLLFGPSSLPLFVGIAILRQIRETLLASEINGCFVLFSESFPEVDIEKCMQSALSMCKVTPPSVTYRVHDPNSLGGPDSHVNPNETRVENNHDWKVLDVEIVEKERREDGHDGAVDEGEQWWERPISIAVKNKELAPRLSITDFIKIKPHALVLDIRGEIEFQRGHLPLSFNIQQSLLAMFGTTLKKLNMKYHVVLAKRDDAGPQFAADLVRIGFSRVGLLQGGLDAVRAAESRDPGSCPMCQCRPNKQTIASNTSNKGKVSEPSFVILRCKPKTGGTSGSSVKLAPAPPASKSSRR